ncbi:methyl-accepting chemotaxis protein [Vibrio xiamenensis]|uniref:Methyl-accepting chemotaxis protein n=1 Tax=Vibrio xiamenensis TaxID=861298 RepID=A0A1G8AM98_9VIBR|nr:methyl-accepting chemotaxis protein [Vibrio xiamenensis]SDH21973.1 methyl-accepting chemotaxis protein [Vibrio xiamenensis]
MKQLGFKRLLLLSVILLVGLSVSVSSFISYSNTKSSINDLIITSGQDYIKGRAQLVESFLGEKISGVKGLGDFYKDKDFPGSTAKDYIALTEVLATALNTGSSFIGFEDSGDAYWNQETSAWPNHKFNGDIREQSYYQDGRRAVTPSVTDPYPDESNSKIYWISIVQKVKQGMMGADMKLDFLTKLVKDSTDIVGSVALIVNQDSTVLASTSDAVKVGDKGVDYPWFNKAITQAINNESTYVHYELNGVDKILFSHRIKVADKNWYFAIGLDTSVAFAMLDTKKRSAIIIALVAMLVSVIVAYLLIQVLYRPILSLNRTIQDLASGDGDLTQRLTITTNDELGTIASGVNKFIAGLQVMLKEIQESSNVLQTNVAQLKNQSQSNAAILQSHVSETEQIVAAIEEMNATANSMATDAANTAGITQQADTTSVQSVTTLRQSQNTVSALIKDVESAADNVNRMSQETQEINKVLSVIGDIAEQTNLLALNAAIEAARAGEQGRGFAVVADEVRNLASRTKSSTEEVEDALSKLLKGTQVVVESMENTKQRCQETADGSGEVGESLETMTTYVAEINTLSAQIATAAEEQSSVTQELSRNMAALNDIVGELDSNGRRALSDMDNIASVNDKLVRIVGRFKL